MFCDFLAEIFQNHPLIRWIGHTALVHHPERRWSATDCMVPPIRAGGPKDRRDELTDEMDILKEVLTERVCTNVSKPRNPIC